MPEGDTVWRTAAGLDRALAGRVLTGSDLRVPRLATVDLTGRRVREVTARGKHLLMRLDETDDDPVPGGLTIHSHLRMEGSWHVYRPGVRWRGPAFQVRAVLRTADAVAVGFRLPVLQVLPTAAESDVVGHLGPDLLDPAVDLDEAVGRLRRDPTRPIGSALLDQRLVAGLGNLYRLETLFRHGINPWTPVGDVGDLTAVLVTGRDLMRANLNRPRQVTTGEDAPGRRTAVFDRAGRPCRRCGTRIRQARQGTAPQDRQTTWCPTCQPGPAASQAAAQQ